MSFHLEYFYKKSKCSSNDIEFKEQIMPLDTMTSSKWRLHSTNLILKYNYYEKYLIKSYKHEKEIDVW